MPTPDDRIPIPWPQRWELIRERLLPAACFVLTLVAAGVLWRHQSTVSPHAIGEVHADSVEIKSPCNGELVAVAKTSDGQWPLFAKVNRSDVLFRIKDRDDGDRIVEIASPLNGVIAAAPALPGQLLRKGEPILKIASREPDYILCHLIAPGQKPPNPGTPASIRLRGPGARWHSSVVEGVGPLVEPAPTYQGAEAMSTNRGIPVRLAVPEGLELTPGSLVEVRFPPTPSPR